MWHGLYKTKKVGSTPPPTITITGFPVGYELLFCGQFAGSAAYFSSAYNHFANDSSAYLATVNSASYTFPVMGNTIYSGSSPSTVTFSNQTYSGMLSVTLSGTVTTGSIHTLPLFNLYVGAPGVMKLVATNSSYYGTYTPYHVGDTYVIQYAGTTYDACSCQAYVTCSCDCDCNHKGVPYVPKM